MVTDAVRIADAGPPCADAPSGAASSWVVKSGRGASPRLPPGAGGNLFRNTAFFDGAGSGGQLAVLLVWTLPLGLGALMAGVAIQRRRTPVSS